MTNPVSIGIIAPSSVVPQDELKRGVSRLESQGFVVSTHPQCRKKHLFFAGSDEERAQAFFDFASDPQFSVLWCARGGYGAIRLIPLLDRLTLARGVPSQKTLVGYSDVTVLHEYVRRHWGWKTLHAPMPGTKQFRKLSSRDFKSLTHLVQGRLKSQVGRPICLKFLHSGKARETVGEMVGGNLTVWGSMMGTPLVPQVRGKILFFEDVSEALYRLDRVAQQIDGANGFEGVRALVLGSFYQCEDQSTQGLRAKVSLKKALLEIFGSIGKQLQIPVAYGLAVGHGKRNIPLSLGASYRLTSSGELTLVSWDWPGRS